MPKLTPIHPSDLEKILIPQIVDAMKSLGVNQHELAASTGIAQANISRALNGKCKLASVLRLANSVGIKLYLQMPDDTEVQASPEEAQAARDALQRDEEFLDLADILVAQRRHAIAERRKALAF